ncbi:MAG: trypsin-like peptidase domain-containing protein [Clostridia bacterium]|nr:trypsin-like peptidase domain-containing protein [Clostridia bacterium]
MKLCKHILATVSLLLALLILPGCALTMHSRDIEDAHFNEKGELVVTYKDGSTQTLGGAESGEGAAPSVNLTVNGTESDIANATTKGLQSAVTVLVGGSISGSGVIYLMDKSAGDAFIITNYHVVYDSYRGRVSNELSLYLYGAEYESLEIPATYVGGSMYYDIAVLRIEDSERLRSSTAVATVELADSDLTSVGTEAIAVGNPRGLGLSATYGIVSVDSESITMKAADESTTVSLRVLRIDTAVNNGNSGGGLYDACGKLIGIVNAKISSTSVENIAYAIPSNVVRAVADNIIDHCYGTSLQTVQRPTLGISISLKDSSAVINTETGGLSIVETVIVSSDVTSGPAKGQLKRGDVLRSIKIGDGAARSITRSYHAVDAMLDARVGDTVEITVLRGNDSVTASFTVTESMLVSR